MSIVPVSAAIWPRQIGASSTSTPLARAFSASILTCSGVQVDDTPMTLPAPIVSSSPPWPSITAVASSS